jgi:hypothetical protein
MKAGGNAKIDDAPDIVPVENHELADERTAMKSFTVVG